MQPEGEGGHGQVYSSLAPRARTLQREALHRGEHVVSNQQRRQSGEVYSEPREETQPDRDTVFTSPNVAYVLEAFILLSDREASSGRSARQNTNGIPLPKDRALHFMKHPDPISMRDSNDESATLSS